MTVQQGAETDLIQKIDSDVTNMSTISKCLLLFHGNLSVLLHVLHKIKNKINVKTQIAQNNTDLSCIKLDINVSKCCAFVKHFKTLISSLTNQCHSELFLFLHMYFIFSLCTGHERGHLNFHGITINLFDIVFMFKIFNKSIDNDDNRWISWY